jgi:hypothetical protein
MVQLSGLKFAERILNETLRIEQNGGLPTSTGKRRSPVSVFFYLAELHASNEIALPPPQPTKRKKKPWVEPPPLTEEKLASYLVKLQSNPGKATTVKVTLVGRPESMKQRPDVTLLVMQYKPKSEGMPKGLPPMPKNATLVTVYVGGRQWRKVKDALANPDDMLVVEGILAYDNKLQQIVVYTINATTKLTEQAKREAQKAQAEAAKAAEATGLSASDAPASDAAPPQEVVPSETPDEATAPPADES